MCALPESVRKEIEDTWRSGIEITAAAVSRWLWQEHKTTVLESSIRRHFKNHHHEVNT